jgi:hypothetical protein
MPINFSRSVIASFAICLCVIKFGLGALRLFSPHLRVGNNAACDQISQQRLAGCGVRGRSFPQPPRNATTLDPDRCKNDMIGEVDPIDHLQ